MSNTLSSEPAGSQLIQSLTLGGEVMDEHINLSHLFIDCISQDESTRVHLKRKYNQERDLRPELLVSPPLRDLLEE